MPALTTLRGSPTITHNGRSRAFVNLGLPPVTAVVTPTISQLVHGQTMEDMTGWSTWMSTSNYETEEGTILGVTASFIGDDAPEASDTVLSEFQKVGVRFVVRHSSGYDVSFYTTIITVYPLAPEVVEAATLEGSTAVNETLEGGDAVFAGSAVTLTREHEVSDDGATGWTGTGTTAYIGPATTLAKYYRFKSTATNLGGSVTSYSVVIGPIVTPTVSVVGLTGGKAIIGQEANLSITANVGTITAIKWGSTSGGSEYGTEQSPTTLSAGTAYATATIGGVDYTVSVPVEAAPANEDLVITVLSVGAYDAGEIPITMDGIGTTNGDDVNLVMFPANDPNPTVANTQAGVAFGGAAALDDWATLWAASPATLSVANGIARQMVRLAAVVDDGVAPSDVKVSDAFLIDTTAAVLSGVTPAVDETDVSVTVTSDKALGDIYFGIRLSSSSQLSASAIINTTGDCLETDIDDTPAADGTNAGGFLGLSNGTYVIDAVQVDDFGNVSSVVSSSSFEISAAGLSITEALVGEITTTGGTASDTVSTGAGAADKEVFVTLIYGRSGTDGLTITLGGNAPDATEVSHTPYSATNIKILRWDVPSGGDLTLAISNTASWLGATYRAQVVTGRTTTTPKTANNNTYSALDLSNAVNAGAEIIGGATMANNGTTGNFSLSGLSERLYNQNHNGNIDQQLFHATAGSTETRTMTVTPTGDGSGQVAAALVILE